MPASVRAQGFGRGPSAETAEESQAGGECGPAKDEEHQRLMTLAPSILLPIFRREQSAPISVLQFLLVGCLRHRVRFLHGGVA